MTRWSVILLGSLALTLAKPALAQYAGSDASMNTDIENAGRLSLSQDALRRHQGQGAAGSTASGPDVSLNIVFPGSQTGLDNIETVELVPEGGGAHMCEALAQSKASNRLYSVFIPSKGVAANQRYIVVVSDAVGDKYEVGHIAVSGGRNQSFTVYAPLLTPSSPTFKGQDTQGDASPYSSAPAAGGAPVEDWRHQRAPDGRFYAGPPLEDGQESAYARAEFGREAAVQPWLFGMKVLTITPYMVAAIGHPGEKLRAVVVYAVLPGSPADVAGIRKGDVIAEIDGHRCFSAEQFAEYAFHGPRGPAELVMYSQEAHGVVRRPIAGEVRWDGSADGRSFRHDRDRGEDGGWSGRHRPVTGDVRWGAPANGPEGDGRDFDRRHDHGGSDGAWHHPAGTAGYHAPTTGPGYLPPASGPAYVPPTTGPGFVPPGQGTAPSASTGTNHPHGGKKSKWQQQQTQVPPLPPGSSGFKPPVVGPGYVPPGKTASSQPASHPQPAPKHKTGPAPSTQGSSGFKAPSTGPGYQRPGG